MDGVKDWIAATPTPPPRPESAMGKGSPITSSTQGSPSPRLPLALGILHPGALQTE